MAIGERIHYFRTLRGMTQKYLGQLIGFPEKSADVRLAQYEVGTRSPKADVTAALAAALDVCPEALAVPDIDSEIGLMHTLFALNDMYGLTVADIDGEICLRVDKSKGVKSAELWQLLYAWQEQKVKLNSGEISEDDYEHWCRYFPKYDTTHIRAKVPSQALSVALVKPLGDRLK
ncbi:MAG: helix-turn-helix transcriptional regulator [Oscillospiraceae bacterium]|nr:helix-turn-helix transcriptional regulator [Oscillospiraceae bacterium]